MYGKIDANQKEIVSVFRKMGFSVCLLSSLGNGVPDILVGYGSENYLFEIKDGSKPPSKRKLTEDEENFFKTWRGHCDIIESVDETIEIIKKIIKRNYIKLVEGKK